MDHGRVNPTMKLDHQGITGLGAVYYNLLEPDLMQKAIERSEGTLGQGGTLLVTTGKHTGRSPKDKFVVRTPDVVDTIWWENNPPMEPAAFGNPVDTAVFFGLSGTGKTTLSADPSRVLIGDDEHGWSDRGTFNFEGGCYAKTISLSAEAEPEIYATTQKFATVIENMVFDPETKELDFEDSSLTANMRCAYPLGYISNASESALGGHPKNIIMLTCDAYGVLPPIARLTPAQAMYHFLSGFTSKVAGTERGVTEPEPTFSTCFGAPFMPRRPEVYGKLLQEKIATHGATCWLVNTGWTGGAYGTGKRMPIKATRALLSAALDGTLIESTFRKDANFGFDVPVTVEGVDARLLDPRSTWADTAAYDKQAHKLVEMFAANFAKYVPYIDEDVKAAAIG
ncbi:MAG: phosphoenolpyruvate carboxykinase (ATP) [Rhodobacteraceae bacterium]|nr:phosphoenolpyruvate carboxykinase (ATP) [Paracoccaceae bacterium]